MEIIYKIEIIKKDIPILNSEYNNWIIALSSMKKKKKIKVYTFFKEIIKLLDDIYKIYYIRILINDKLLSIDNILSFDLKSAIKELKEVTPIIDKDKITLELKSNVKSKNLPNIYEKENKSYIDILEKMDKTLMPNIKCFYYHQIKVPDYELFTFSKDKNGYIYKVIKKQYLPYLRYIDLSDTNFDKTDLRNIDLSFTNISKINFDTLYKRSIKNTNLQNVILVDHELSNICAKGANLLGTFLRINIDTTDIDKAQIDTSILLFNNKKEVINTTFLTQAVKSYKPKPSLHI